MVLPLRTALKRVLPSKPPPTLSRLPGNLYEVLSRYPRDGVGQKIRQTRWDVKGVEGSYWEITRTQIKCEGKHGKAWGVLVWKGRRTSEKDEKIRGGLKYRWAVGESRAVAGRPSPSPAPPSSTPS